MTVLEKAEAAYNLIKIQIDELLSKPETDEEDEISEQNTDMLEYFNQLNQIVSYLSDNSKIPTKIKHNKKPEKIVDPSINNEKILNIYKKENEKLKERINKYKDPEYRIKLETDKTKSEQRINELELKNKNLEKEQKIAEIQLEKISKGKTNENKLRMILMDFNNKQREYNKLLQKVEKEKREKNENDAKIKELNEWKEKLEKIAVDMYNIQEMKDINLLQKKKNENLEKFLKLKKQYEIMENAKKVNTKKYDNIIAANEKDIYDLNQEKIALMKELEKQLKINDKLGKKINEFYGIKGNDNNKNNNE
jgi:hypothetical protein